MESEQELSSRGEVKPSHIGLLLCMLRLVPFRVSPFQMKGLDVDTLFVSHIQVNRAPKQRRRTYRAHGRINGEWALTASAGAHMGERGPWAKGVFDTVWCCAHGGKGAFSGVPATSAKVGCRQPACWLWH